MYSNPGLGCINAAPTSLTFGASSRLSVENTQIRIDRDMVTSRVRFVVLAEACTGKLITVTAIITRLFVNINL